MDKILDFGYSFLKGLFLSGSVYILGIILDNTICINSKNYLVENKPKIYNKGMYYAKTNLLVISPVIYSVIDHYILDHHKTFSIPHFITLIGIQNIGYYTIHREFHMNKNLYWIHKFHHCFDDVLIPSVGNAVSYYEFLIGYIFPITTGAFFTNCDEVTFLSAIGMTSLLNLLIHTNELNNTWWIPYLVSPTNHIIHHKKRKKHYAAPFLDLDKIKNILNP